MRDGRTPGLSVPGKATVRAVELLFDMDGTLIDSIAAVEAAWKTLAEEQGVEIPSGAKFHGRTASDLIEALVPSDRAGEALVRLEELENSPGAPVVVLPGTQELLAELPPARWSIVTSAARSVALARLTAAGLSLPNVLITGDDVEHGKPNPEPYRMARRHSGTAMAFEDTVAGLQSARSAGCTAVGIIGTTTADELAPYADYLIESLASVKVVKIDDAGIHLYLDLTL